MGVGGGIIVDIPLLVPPLPAGSHSGLILYLNLENTITFENAILNYISKFEESNKKM